MTPETKLTPEEVDSYIVDCGLYREGERLGGKISLESALQRARDCGDGFAWIGVQDPSPEVVHVIAEHFGLHPLAVEDAIHAHQRPKLELHGDSVFAVLKTARYVDSEELVHIGELMVFMGKHFVVTVRHGHASPLTGVRSDLEAHPDLLSIGPSSVLYAVIDHVVDDYAAVLAGLEQDIDEIEVEVFSDTNSNRAQRIYRLKREVLEFRKAVKPLIEPVAQLASSSPGLPVDPRTEPYFRDVQDHLIRDGERVAALDELLTSALQANLAQLSMRDNRDMRRISAWVAIGVVPTMVFGLYGMNFDQMPELGWDLGYPAVLVFVAVVCGALYWRLRKAGWL
ncbi:MAG: magnesium and cobalt transport protein CorA [Solirubrobacteraceae bacterium]|nr:magnesium and cobalt transport protein CorA [Solirubrobacteraceae bacterium]